MQRMTVRDIDEERFFKIPKVLNEDDYYMKLPVMARYLYGVMLDRFKLSKSKGWINKDGEVYFIFKQKALSELLNVSVNSIKKCIKELKEHQLIESESTLTVNLYYISFPMPRTTGKICPTSGSIELTNSQNVANNSETDINDTNKRETETLHHTDSVTDMFLNLLNSFSKEKFGKPIRKHDSNKIYIWDDLEDYGKEEMIEILNICVTKYEYANLDYLETIQARFR